MTTFCASSAEAAKLSDEEFWASVYGVTDDERVAMEAEAEAEWDREVWVIHCARCGRFAEVDETERADRERDAFCDDCADEHLPDFDGGLLS